MWGFSLETWDRVAFLTLLLGSIFAGIGIALTGFSSFVSLRTAAIAQRISDERIANATARGEEAKTQAAFANERAAEANKAAEQERLARLELERKLAWRRLNDEQSIRLTDACKPYAGTKFTVITYSDDPEALTFATHVLQALQGAGWTFEKSDGVLGFSLELSVNVEVAPSREAELAPAANAVINTLNEMGFPTSGSLREGLDKKEPERIRIRVGKKPDQR